MRYGGRLGLLTKTITTAAVSAALLAACSGNTPEPSSEPPKKTPKAEPTPSKTPARSVAPTAGEKPEVYAARQWIEAFNNSKRTLDPGRMLSMSRSRCDTCQAHKAYLAELKKNGGRYEGDVEEKVEKTSSAVRSGRTYVYVDISAGAFKIYERRDAKPIVAEPDKYRVGFLMEREGSRWVVAQSDQLPD